MDKQKLLNQVQAARGHLDQAAEGQHEIGNILSAAAQLADVLEQVISAIDKRRLTGADETGREQE